MEIKHADILAEFKKGNLPEEGLAKMTALVNSLIPQFK
jgi:F-type H+-transporting ATPase subunit alpha